MSTDQLIMLCIPIIVIIGYMVVIDVRITEKLETVVDLLDLEIRNELIRIASEYIDRGEIPTREIFTQVYNEYLDYRSSINHKNDTELDDIMDRFIELPITRN